MSVYVITEMCRLPWDVTVAEHLTGLSSIWPEHFWVLHLHVDCF